MSRQRQTKRALSAAVIGLILAGCGESGTTSVDPQHAQTSQRTTTPASAPTSGHTDDIDPQSGLPWVSADVLPPEAADTLAAIDRGGPYKFDNDGAVFGNREGILPEQRTGYYHEYTVVTPGSDDRGARRIVTGSGGELYYTADHYDSFARIAR